MRQRGKMKLLLSSLLLSSLCALSSWSVSSAILIVTQSLDVSVMEGDTLNITCCWTEKFERVKMQWLKNQAVIKGEINMNQPQESLQKEPKSCSSLIFSNITREDSGRFRVSVEIPSLTEATGNGTAVTVTVREKNHTHPRTNVLIYTLRTLPFILLLLFLCYFKKKWSAPQHHSPAAAGRKTISAQSEEQEERHERETVETTP